MSIERADIKEIHNWCHQFKSYKKKFLLLWI